jgi:hypothetical protein
VSNRKKLLEVPLGSVVSKGFCSLSLHATRSVRYAGTEDSCFGAGLDFRIPCLAFAALVARTSGIPVDPWRDQQRPCILHLLQRSASRVDEKPVVKTSDMFRLDATGACGISRSRCDVISMGPSHGG